MDDTALKYRGGKLETNKVHSLGHRAFYLFLFRRIKYIAIVVIVVAFLWYAERWVPVVYMPYAIYAVKIIMLLAAAILFLIVFRAFLEYRYYTYTFTEEAFIMTYGVVIQRELAAPYHQIQHVILKRTLFERAMGVSQIIIFLAGADKEESQMKIVLPAVGSQKAKLVQKELLVRMRQKI
jgi:membrane protein YdbS with pleckstrin-like domain